MPWNDDDSHPFAGIAKKLERADESIVNLHNEITKFFSECKYPAIPKPHAQGWQEAIDYHKALTVPKRFSVLSGEIVHHLRSCLDHVVWHFSSPEARRDHDTAIEFPVFRDEPLTKDKLRGYDRKVQGITNTNVLAIIKRLQPYQRGSDAINDPLCIIHDMDRFDKHRELVIVDPGAHLEFPAGTSAQDIIRVVRYRDGKLTLPEDIAAAKRTVKVDANVSPQVAFAKFGNREGQSVIPSLMHLLYSTDDVIELFAAEV